MSKNHGMGRSSPGTANLANEDSFYADDSLGLYVVCDGAGRSGAGGVASRVAVDAVADYIERSDEADGRPDIFANALATRAIQYAFAAIAAKESSSPALRGMTSTLTLLLLRNRRAVIGHVGDSRLYLVRDENLHQLTVDHPLTNRTTGDPELSESLAPDTFRLPLLAGDTLILCTDGMNDVMNEHEHVVAVMASQDLSWITAELLRREDELGGVGDATVVVIRIADDNHRPLLSHFINRDFEIFQTLRMAAA